MKKQIRLLVILIFIVGLCNGCNPFSYPTGVWTSEDFDMIVDFDLNEGTNAQIIIDGVSQDIIFDLWITGDVHIYYFSEITKPFSRRDYLYKSFMRNKGKNKMYFAIDETDEVYIFTRQE